MAGGSLKDDGMTLWLVFVLDDPFDSVVVPTSEGNATSTMVPGVASHRSMINESVLL